jgi:hypothetical protein
MVKKLGFWAQTAIYYTNMSHPTQAARKTLEWMPKLKYANMLIANEYGEMWMMTVTMKGNKRTVKMYHKYGPTLSTSDVDMVFNTKNMRLYGGVVQ